MPECQIPPSAGPQGGALSGLKVLELAHVIAGPLAGTLLADLGADVVHIEAPGVGDTARLMGPKRDGFPLWWKVGGRNKRSVTLDLRASEGREVARRLVEWADVVITNFRVSTLREWGLAWEDCHALKNTLVYCQISGYGIGSSLEDAPGFGKVGEARSGVVHLTGFPEGPPVYTGFSHADSVTALMAAFAISSALYRRESVEEFDGEWIDLALSESLFRLIEWQVIIYDQLGIVPERAGNRLSVAPGAVINTYRTGDEEWLTVTSATLRSVQNIAELLGLPPEDFVTSDAQLSRAGLLDTKLAEWISLRSTDESLSAMTEAGVVASRVLSVKDIVEDQVYAERGSVIAVDDSDLGTVRMQGVIPKMRVNPGSVWRTGASLGADNELVLSEWLGISSSELQALKDAGVV
ncbi:MAG: CaiB/BaiF CoA transferase family protein [Acidimicrobiales bacterium]